MKRVACDALIWSAAIAALLLPAWLDVGYPLASAECLLVVAGSGLIGGLFGVLAPVGSWRSAIVGALLLIVYLQIYFAAQMPTVTGYLAALGLVVLIAFLILRRAAVIALAVAFTAGAAGAWWVAPVQVETFTRDVAPTNSGPAVIHILLDEHAAPDGFPKDLQPTFGDAVGDFYSSRGFVVFDKSYSWDMLTPYSVARLFHPDTPDVVALVTLSADKSAWRLSSLPSLEEMARTRVLDLTTTSFVNFDRAATSLKGLASLRRYREGMAGEVMARSGMTFADRLWISGALVSTWMTAKQIRPYVWFLSETALGHRVRRLVEARDRIHPLVAMAVLSDFIDRLQRSGRRGEYYFLHALLPHHPYVFDRECQVRPAAQWVNRIAADGPNSPETRRRRYGLYAEQVRCVQTQVDRLLKVIAARPGLEDAIVVLHGDHGSRISLEETSEWAKWSYNWAMYQRDWRAAFFAVRLPAVAGRREERPAAIHDLFRALVANDFTSLPVPKSQINAPPPLDACTRWSAAAPRRPYAQKSSLGFIAAVPEFASSGDTNEMPFRSKLLLCEDGRLIGRPYEIVADIMSLGMGRFTHWIGDFWFSSSDGSDPNTNGRTYTIVHPD